MLESPPFKNHGVAQVLLRYKVEENTGLGHVLAFISTCCSILRTGSSYPHMPVTLALRDLMPFSVLRTMDQNAPTHTHWGGAWGGIYMHKHIHTQINL